ncbi:uncharacterized protein N7443_010092 [Penicillium atrosanguineum]|uniref:uncharacterized protein n=1 Tax=Penicillium atrosanguineum TaxID=1132637 RepID=UPI0023A2DB1B|nr:uncharacterized protein N7443_010092 [Penicillium atrosanguineum]KAJ5137617.1 hypothetical protein N7526_003850 [Penicillium atrosanguineum]KAJ5289839.1 hypothetical protein N7443_010092 [Penicillium atrosanguineum]
MTSEEDIPGYYEALGQWSGVETPGFPANYMGVNPSYCTGPMVPPTMLTPISLPDSSFRPSPALSHHSQEYAQDYSYAIEPAQGLGISAPFPSEYPRTSAPDASYMYAQEDMSYGTGHTPIMSPGGPPPKRTKRASSKSSRDTPINILPNPEGIQRMERAPPQTPPVLPRIRGSGRGRRDPQAEQEDEFVENLRQQNVAWKVVRDEFQKTFNKQTSEARLQMRLLRRRKERLTRWEDNDVQLLISAHESWENEKFRFISDKVSLLQSGSNWAFVQELTHCQMREFGSTKDYTAEQCKAQLQLLEAKQQNRRESGSTSPSAMSDPPHTPSLPSISRKRARPQSWDEHNA